uniref:Regulatory protein E2 n=1 Tax=Miniopterus schreibersii papillomavirus 1 TaxID=1195364 RepID=I3VR53_9PAPI|nr:E2 [Miniopterus schreibersii papillomavirus 1]
MEQLKARLDVIQENLLKHYESGSTNLTDHIDYWNNERKENVLFYYARTKGINRIGMSPVPALIVSQSKAKDAIAQQMILESLAQSAYGEEAWTLQDVSREKYLTEPKYTFKKGGSTVDVRYGHHALDYVPYTMWDFIYFQDDKDKWHKVKGEVDYEGLFYSDGGTKVYYADFGKDAARYGNPNVRWEVHCKNCQFLSTSVSSSSAGGAPKRPRLPSPQPATSSSSGDSTPPKRRQTATGGGSGRTPRKGRPTRTPRKHTSQGPGKAHTPPPASSSLFSGDSEGEEGEGGTEAQREREEGEGRTQYLRGGLRGRRVGRGGGGGRGERGEGGSGQHGPQLRGHQPQSPQGAEAADPAPWEVGARHRTVDKGASTRLQRLIQEARDPPVLLLGGEPNQLKCVRYRLKAKHSALFTCCTTTFCWVCNHTTEKSPCARIMVAFKDSQQRSKFLGQVSLPKGITITMGALDSL